MKLPTLRPHRRLALAWWLAAALLFVQTLGLAHGVLHAGTPRGSDPALFGHQSGGDDCRLYDQLSHGDALAVALPLLPPALPAAPAAAPLQQGTTPAFAAAYCARGPPRG